MAVHHPWRVRMRRWRWTESVIYYSCGIDADRRHQVLRRIVQRITVINEPKAMQQVHLLLALIIALPATAQEVVSSGGDHHSGTNVSISYTIGEPVIATASAGGTTLTQGFHQPWVDITTMVSETTADGTDIVVYPNPVRHILHIALDGDPEGHQYILHDAAGKQVTDGRIATSITELDMQRFASGSYFLHVLGPNDTHLRTFKLSVTH